VVMKDGEKLILVDEHLDKVTKGKAEVEWSLCAAPEDVDVQADPRGQFLPTGPDRL